jgi:hypothetical protein
MITYVCRTGQSNQSRNIELLQIFTLVLFRGLFSLFFAETSMMSFSFAQIFVAGMPPAYSG